MHTCMGLYAISKPQQQPSTFVCLHACLLVAGFFLTQLSVTGVTGKVYSVDSKE